MRWKATRLCHSVLSVQLPVWSLARSAVASEKLATVMPPWVVRISGSLPTLPRRMTLLTPFAMVTPFGVEDSRTSLDRSGCEKGVEFAKIGGRRRCRERAFVESGVMARDVV